MMILDVYICICIYIYIYIYVYIYMLNINIYQPQIRNFHHLSTNMIFAVHLAKDVRLSQLKES
jgi:hypothetical protein